MKFFCMFLYRIVFIFNFYVLHFYVLGVAVVTTFPLTCIKFVENCSKKRSRNKIISKFIDM